VRRSAEAAEEAVNVVNAAELVAEVVIVKQIVTSATAVAILPVTARTKIDVTDAMVLVI
jgi:hypothetical protein